MKPTFFELIGNTIKSWGFLMIFSVWMIALYINGEISATPDEEFAKIMTFNFLNSIATCLFLFGLICQTEKVGFWVTCSALATIGFNILIIGGDRIDEFTPLQLIGLVVVNGLCFLGFPALIKKGLAISREIADRKEVNDAS